jgi:hypothetical protein
MNSPIPPTLGEKRKTNRDDVADQLIGDQHHVFPGDEQIEFALAL